MSDAERLQQRATEFLRLLPLTIELAGLPKSEPGKHFTEEQLEGRAMTLRRAHKVARQMLSEVAAQQS